MPLGLPYDCSFSQAPGLYTDDRNGDLFFPIVIKSALECPRSWLAIGIKLEVLIILLCVGDRSAVTGTQ